MKKNHNLIFRKKISLLKFFAKSAGKTKFYNLINKAGLPTFSQLKLLPKFLSRPEKKILKILTAIIIISGGFLSINFYLSHTVIAAKAGGEYIEGIVGAPKLLNPVQAQNNEVDMDLAQLLFSGLLKQKENKLEPDIALKYDISEDKTTYTFYLRPDLKWSDGETVTADDIILTVENIQNPEFNSPLYESLKGVLVTKLDDSRVQFKLAKPFSPFLSLLTFGLLPAHIWSFINPASAGLADFNIKSPVGTGPFMVKSLKKDSRGTIKSYTLTGNPNYYGQKPYLEKIIVKFFPNYEEAVAALNNRNIDGLNFLPKKYQDLIANKEINIKPLSLPQYRAIFFNETANEFLKDKKIRQALSMAIDKKLIINQALDKQAVLIYGPILPGFIGYDPNIKKYEYNLAVAEKMIADAGWQKISLTDYKNLLKEKEEEKIKNDDKLSEKTEKKDQATPAELNLDQEFFLKKNNDILSLNFVTVNQPENIAVAEIIKSAWQKIGVKVNLNLIEANIFLKDIIAPRNFDALLYGELTSFDPDPYPFWHSSQSKAPGFNIAMYVNQKVDILLEEARQISDDGERAKKYVEFQNILMEDLPAIFLYNPTYSYLLSSKIKGFNLERIILPSDRLNGAEKWYIQTKREFSW